MKKPKMVPIQVSAAKELIRLMDRLEEKSCIGCPGGVHETACPAAEAFAMRNYLTRRVNNQGRHYTV
jgi:hypothetical protein